MKNVYVVETRVDPGHSWFPVAYYESQSSATSRKIELEDGYRVPGYEFEFRVQAYELKP